MSDPLLERLAYLAGDDASFQKELIALFLSESQKNIQKLQDDIKASDHAQAARAAHAIKGASLNVGARTLSVISENLEMNLEQGKVDQERVAALTKEFTEIEAKLQAYLKTL